MVDASLLAHHFRNPNLFDHNAKPNYLFLSSLAPHVMLGSGRDKRRLERLKDKGS